MSPGWASATWSTDLLPEADQLEHWRSVVWDAFSPVGVDGTVPGTFAATLVAGALGVIGIGRITAAAQAVRRSADHVVKGDPGVFFLNLALEGGSTVSQDGRTATLGPGDFVVIDSGRPFAQDFPDRFDQLSLVLPKERFLPHLRAPETATAIAIRGNAGTGAVASGAIRGLQHGAVPPHAFLERAVADQLIGLIGLAVQEAAEPVLRPPSLLEMVKAETLRGLADPDLSPATVAGRVGVSTRYLHKLFAASGLSFGRWLLATRLEGSARMLRDPACTHLTVAEIALDHGLRDPSHFARVYKARYGISPTESRPAAVR